MWWDWVTIISPPPKGFFVSSNIATTFLFIDRLPLKAWVSILTSTCITYIDFPFPCQYSMPTFPANIGFAGPYERATLKRRREPTPPVTRARRLMKRPNMAAPVWSVTDMRDNPKTINRNGVYIHYNNSLIEFMALEHMGLWNFLPK